MKVIIDYVDGNKRAVKYFISGESFDKSIDIFKNISKVQNIVPGEVVRFVNGDTGEVVKGPKYDTVDLDIDDKEIEKNLKPGIKIQEPSEDLQYEPRDRFQESANMSKKAKQTLRDLIKECREEIKKETPRERLKESLRPLVKKMLGEIATVKIKDIDDEKSEKEKIQKGYDFARQGLYKKGGSTQRLDITNKEKEEELSKLVKGIDDEWEVYWDDHLELNVDAKNCGRIRITPKFENNFDIDFMWKLVDRIRAIALTWEQVKEFVKANLKELKGEEGNKTKADKSNEKALANRVDQDKNQKDAGPDWDKVKNRGEKDNGEDAKIKSTKKDDMDYNEPAVKKDEDMPDQPMKQVVKPGEDPEGKNHDIKKTDKVKPPKHKNDKKLRISDKKTPKFVKKQVS